MFATERRQLILDVLTRDGRVEVASLADTLGVSEDTVRRDLKMLTEQGFLQKTHGGAVLLDTARIAFPARHQVRADAKTSIGQRAAQLAEAGQTLFIDAGTTALELARALPPLELTVITQSLDVAAVLAERPLVQLILCGGEWDREGRYFSGSSTEQQLQSYRADLAFVGACAVHEHLGLTATGAGDARVKAAMVGHSACAILLADHSKFGQIAPHAVAHLNQFQHLITDNAPAWVDKLPLQVDRLAAAAESAVMPAN